MKGTSIGVPPLTSVVMGELFWQHLRDSFNHVINKHSGFSDPLFNKCANGNIEPRKCLRSGMFIGEAL